MGDLRIIIDGITDIFSGIARSVKMRINPKKYPFRNVKIGVVVSNFDRTINYNAILRGFIEQNLIDKGAKIVFVEPQKVIKLFGKKGMDITIFKENIDLLIVCDLSLKLRMRKFEKIESGKSEKKQDTSEFYLEFRVYHFGCHNFVGYGTVCGSLPIKSFLVFELFKKFAKEVLESITITREGNKKNGAIKIEVHTKFDDIIKNLIISTNKKITISEVRPPKLPNSKN